jgi:hypothetical protein
MFVSKSSVAAERGRYHMMAVFVGGCQIQMDFYGRKATLEGDEPFDLVVHRISIRLFESRLTLDHKKPLVARCFAM